MGLRPECEVSGATTKLSFGPSALPRRGVTRAPGPRFVYVLVLLFARLPPAILFLPLAGFVSVAGAFSPAGSPNHSFPDS